MDDKRLTLGTFIGTPEMHDAVQAVIYSGRLSYGPFSQAFEHNFSEIHGRQYGVLSNSGTSSLVVALQTLKLIHGWKRNDQVLIPALTFVATANAVLHNNLFPVPVDIYPGTFNMDLKQLEKAIRPHTCAIMPVNLFGIPANLPAICEIAQKHGLPVIEDSCETMFSSIDGKPVGSYGDIACFSMYMAHTLPAGVGGIAITDSLDYAQMMRSLVNHGIDLAELPSGKKYDPSFLERNFIFTHIGHSFRITELEAAIAIEQLKRKDEIVLGRKRTVSMLREVLHPFRKHILQPNLPEEYDPCYMVYPLVMEAEPRYRIMRYLRANNIECRDLLPLVTQPCYSNYWDLNSYPIARMLNGNGFYIGCHERVTPEQVRHLAGALQDYFKGKASS